MLQKQGILCTIISFPFSVFYPTIHRSTVPNAKLRVKGETKFGWITFDASESVDRKGNPCAYFTFDFGDGTPPIAITSSSVTRSYSQPGLYRISVTVMDKYGQINTAFIMYSVKRSSSTETMSINSQRLLTCYQQQNNKKLKRQKKRSLIQHNYDPPISQTARGNIVIHRQITTKLIPGRVDVKCIKDLYSYLDKLTALQWNKDDDYKHDVGDIKVMDYDLYEEKTKEKVYCLIKRQDESIKSSRKYKWIMDKILYNKAQLQAMGITRLPLLRSIQFIASLGQNKSNIDEMMKRDINAKIQSIAFCKIDIYNKQRVKKNDGLKWVLSAKKFREYCENNRNWESILIVMSYQNNQNMAKCIEYLSIIKTESGKCDIGVSVKHKKANDSLFITGLHIDKQAILEQHQLAMPYKHNQNCKCLDSWDDTSNITHLVIGDVNQHRIDKYRLEQELETKTEIMNTMISISNLNSAPMISTPPTYSTSSLSTAPTHINSLQSSIPTSQQYLLVNNGNTIQGGQYIHPQQINYNYNNQLQTQCNNY